MGISLGQVRFSDGHIMYCGYQNTADILQTGLFVSADDLKSQAWNDKCTCGKEESVRLAVDYGGGFSWDGKACRFCKVITAGHDPYGDAHIGWSTAKPIDTKMENGLPDWWI